MIDFKCDKCGADMQAPEDTVGRLEVCPNCKDATLVRDQTFEAELVQQKAKYEKLKYRQDGFSLVGWALCILYAISLRLDVPIPFPIGVLGGVMLIWSAQIISRRKRLRRKWLLERGSKTEEMDRQKACRTVLELRESGRTVKLCEKCVGTGGGTVLRCRKCQGRGYVEY